MIDGEIEMRDFDDLERLHKAMFSPGLERERWKAQAHLIRYLEEHPTLLPYCIAAGREKKRARAAIQEGRTE